MKALPLSAAAALLFAGGMAAARWFWPPALSAAATADAPQDAPAAVAPGTGKSARGASRPAFDGTLESLRAIAKAARSYSRAQREVLAALDALTAAQVGALAAAFPWKSSQPWAENAIYFSLLEAWTEKDADAALRWAATLPQSRQASVRSTIFNTLGDSDMPKALALIDGLKNARERNGHRREMAMKLGLTDPEAAIRIARSCGANGSYAIGSIMEDWAERDPQVAWAAVQNLPRAERDQCLQRVLRSWAQKDTAAAQAAVMSLPAGNERKYALSAVYGGWAANAPAAAFAAASALASRADKQAAMTATINTWAASDPAAALKATESISARSARTQLITNICSTWSTSDPQAAAAAVASLPLNRNERSNLYSSIANWWGREDPDAALTWARSLPEREGRYFVSSLLGNIAGNDPAAASAIWKSLPRSQQRQSLQGLTGGWARTDMDAALAFARSLENPQDRNSAIQSCMGSLTFDEPEKAAALFSQLPAGPTRINAMRQFARSGDGEASVAWMRSLPEAERAAILSSDDYYEWNRQGTDPKEWAALLQDTPGTKPEMWKQAASSLAAEDPAAAVEWAGALEDPALRKTALQSALSQWAQDKPAEAMQAAQALADAQTRGEAMKTIIQHWSWQDPDALLAWAATATGEERESALIRGGLARAEYDPAAGAQIVGQFLHPRSGEQTSAAVNSAAGQVASGWFAQDMEKGTAWVAGLPESAAREAATTAIVREWTTLDPEASSEWVLTLPAGGSRDAAAQTLAYSIGQSDPQSALTWAASIGDAAQREETIVGTLDTWRWQDKEAARAAAESAAISEAARAALLKRIGQQ